MDDSKSFFMPRSQLQTFNLDLTPASRGHKLLSSILTIVTNVMRGFCRLVREVQLTIYAERPGFIYVMKATGGRRNGLYKIGVSVEPQKRKRRLEWYYKCHLAILKTAFCQQPYYNEAHLHKVFSYCNVRHEWFDLSWDDLIHVKAAFYSLDERIYWDPIKQCLVDLT